MFGQSLEMRDRRGALAVMTGSVLFRMGLVAFRRRATRHLTDPFFLRGLDLAFENTVSIVDGAQPPEHRFHRNAVSLLQGGETTGCGSGRSATSRRRSARRSRRVIASETMRRLSSRRRISDTQWPNVGQRPAKAAA